MSPLCPLTGNGRKGANERESEPMSSLNPIARSLWVARATWGSLFLFADDVFVLIFVIFHFDLFCFQVFFCFFLFFFIFCWECVCFFFRLFVLYFLICFSFWDVFLDVYRFFLFQCVCPFSITCQAKH